MVFNVQPFAYLANFARVFGRDEARPSPMDTRLEAASPKNPVHPVNPVENSLREIFSFPFECAARCRTSESVSLRELFCALYGFQPFSMSPAGGFQWLSMFQNSPPLRASAGNFFSFPFECAASVGSPRSKLRGALPHLRKRVSAGILVVPGFVRDCGNWCGITDKRAISPLFNVRDKKAVLPERQNGFAGRGSGFTRALGPKPCPRRRRLR